MIVQSRIDAADCPYLKRRLLERHLGHHARAHKRLERANPQLRVGGRRAVGAQVGGRNQRVARDHAADDKHERDHAEIRVDVARVGRRVERLLQQRGKDAVAARGRRRGRRRRRRHRRASERGRLYATKSKRRKSQQSSQEFN